MFVYDVLCFYHQTVKDMHRLDIHYMYCHGSSTEKKNFPDHVAYLTAAQNWPVPLPAEGAGHPGPCWVAWPKGWMSLIPAGCPNIGKKKLYWPWMRLYLQFKKVLFSKAKPSLEIRQGEGNCDIQMLTRWSTIFSKKLRSSTWLHVSVSVLYHQYHPILVETPSTRC